MGQGRHTLRSISDPVYPRIDRRLNCSYTSATSLFVFHWLFRESVRPPIIGGRGFSAAATSVWNSLPEAVRSSPSLALFRKTLKTELFTPSNYTD